MQGLQLCFLILGLAACCIAQTSTECLYLDPIEEEVCGSFSLSGCLIDIEIDIGGQTIFHDDASVSALSDPKDTCLMIEDCELCFGWESHGILQNGTAMGCITLYGSCVSEEGGHVNLGCFSDNSLTLCPGTCPNDCSGRGTCQFDGTCDCQVGRAGADCSSTCNDRVETINRLEESVSRQFSIPSDAEQGWMGYFFSVEGSQVADVRAVVKTISGGDVDFYAQKSCYPHPDIDFYEVHETIGEDLTTVTVTENCSEIDGGVWYFAVACTTPDGCSFDITIYETPVLSLEFDHQLQTTIQREGYFSFALTPGGPFTVTVTTMADVSDLQVSLLAYECPSDAMAFQHADGPSYVVPSNPYSIGLKQYVLSSVNGAEDTWYIRIVPQQTVTLSIVVTKAVCEQQCQYGACVGPDACVCEVYWAGDACELYDGPSIAGPVGPAPPGSSPVVDDPSKRDSSESVSVPSDSVATLFSFAEFSTEAHPSPIDAHDDDDDDGDGLGAGVIVGIVLTSVSGVVLASCVVVVLLAVVVRRKKKPPADNLYNMLTQEQDLDDM